MIYTFMEHNPPPPTHTHTNRRTLDQIPTNFPQACPPTGTTGVRDTAANASAPSAGFAHELMEGVFPLSFPSLPFPLPFHFPPFSFIHSLPSPFSLSSIPLPTISFPPLLSQQMRARQECRSIRMN